MKLTSLILLFLLLVFNSYAQENTARQWFFGNNAGVDFSTGVPIGVTYGALYHGEGCATVGDINGNLLFYTDGQEVYNSNHLLMPNGTGLLGHNSATQSSIIIPFPGTDSLFYIFTIDATENHLQNGLRYSIIDMSLDGGMGDITGAKNILLESLVCEKISGVLHANNINVWLVAHRWDSDEFVAYEISPSGINTTPVVSAIGVVHQGGYSSDPWVNGWVNAAGYMKSSMLGSKLAVAICRMDKIELFDFNKSTGILSNCISSPTTNTDVYGLEFSPNGTKLYASQTTGKITQFDLTSPTPLNSSITIATPYQPSALQIGPNGEIYISELTSGYLASIHNPNEIGAACNYESHAVYIEGRICRRGLPTLFYYKGFQFFTGSEVDIIICDGDSIFLEGDYQTLPGVYYDTLQSSLGWDSILTINLSFNNIVNTTINPFSCGPYISPSGNYVWTNAGIYLDTLINSFGCENYYTINLTVGNNSSANITLTECNNLVSPSGNYLWISSGIYQDTLINTSGCDSVITVDLTINNSSSAIINPIVCDSFTSPSGVYIWTSSGTYIDVIPNYNGCDSVITINLTVNNTSSIINPSVCDSYISPSGNYIWTNSGIYMDTIPNTLGCDSIITVILNINNSNATIYQSVCNNSTYTSPSGNYTWTTSGTYFDTIPNTLGCDSVITINLTFDGNTNSAISPISCDSYTSPSGNYSWTNSGVYSDTIPNALGCDSIISINLTVNTVDTSITQANNFLIANTAGATYQWVDCDNSYSLINGETNQLFNVINNGNYAVIINSNSCIDTSYCYNMIVIGIDECFSNIENNIYPNPTTGQITINNEELIIKNVAVYDIYGKEVLKQEVGSMKYEVDLSNQPQGIYIVKVITDNQTITIKLIKQ